MVILIPDVLKPPAEIEQQVFGKDAEIQVCQAVSAEQISPEDWARCEAILAYDQIQFTADLIRGLKRCKVLVRVGVGYDNVDLEAAQRHGLIVCNIPDYGSEEVADHAMAMLLSLARGIPEYHRRTRGRDWDRTNALPYRLRGKSLGIVGLGRIGSAMAKRGLAFGMRVLFYDPYKEDGYDKALGVERVESLAELAGKCDVVSLHAPLTDETERMIGRSFFDSLKRPIHLINTARGALIDIEALGAAMREGTVAAAGLDVLPIEPNVDSQTLVSAWEAQEAWIRDRLIVTPHTAFYSPESYREMRTKAALEALRVLEGNPPRNPVSSQPAWASRHPGIVGSTAVGGT